MSYGGKITINGVDYPIATTLYKRCTTGAGDTPKVVQFSDFDTLMEGVVLAVYFEESNTAVNPQLQVGTTPAKIIYTDNINPVGVTPATSWPAKSVVLFLYDGNVWRIINTTKALRAELVETVTALNTEAGRATAAEAALDAAKQKKIRKGTVSLPASSWAGSGPYTQTVTVSGATVTANSVVDIQPDNTVLSHMYSVGVAAIYIANNNGTLTAYAVAKKPTSNLTVQCTVTEVTEET